MYTGYRQKLFKMSTRVVARGMPGTFRMERKAEETVRGRGRGRERLRGISNRPGKRNKMKEYKYIYI